MIFPKISSDSSAVKTGIFKTTIELFSSGFSGSGSLLKRLYSQYFSIVSKTLEQLKEYLLLLPHTEHRLFSRTDYHLMARTARK